MSHYLIELRSIENNKLLSSRVLSTDSGSYQRQSVAESMLLCLSLCTASKVEVHELYCHDNVCREINRYTLDAGA